MSRKANLSLIISSRNREESIRRSLLMSIPQNEMEICNAELILVDSNSTDSTQEVMNNYLQEANFPVKGVYLDQSGLGRARNAGIVNATGDVIAFTDDDCLLTAGYIRTASRYLMKKRFDIAEGK